MPLSESELASVKAKLVSCFDVLSALGDETRFSIVLTLMDGPCIGRRVADVCRAVHLSLSSVSAQMQILVQATNCTETRWNVRGCTHPAH